MRTMVAASVLLGLLSGGAAAEPARQIISVGADALPSVTMLASEHDAPIDLHMANDERVVLEIADDQLLALSEHMHEEFGRCGGYMVHESLDEALAPATPLRDVDYTIDRAEVVNAVLPRLSDVHILQTIRELSSMKNRYYRSESGAAASAWLAQKWRGLAKDRSDVTIELFDQGYPQKSVIMTIPGTTRASEVIVIGGHLDSIAPGGVSSSAPGADDDASGIATLTEIARVLLASDFRPERTIKFMAYAAEEVGLRGSQAIVRDFKARKVDVVGALQLDMTNFQGSDRDIWIIDDFTSKAQNKFLVDLIERYTNATWGSDKCGYACSDHASWHRAGVPASMPFESRSKEMNKRIHTKNDTLEQSKDNALHAVKFARLGTAYAIELAKGTLVTCWWDACMANPLSAACKVPNTDAVCKERNARSASEMAARIAERRRSGRSCATARLIYEGRQRREGDHDRDNTEPLWIWIGLALTGAGALWLSRRAG
ncbi:MAG: M20/M25/M40 family metallo-hydrolase [Kofleriaceae bacterium]